MPQGTFSRVVGWLDIVLIDKCPEPIPMVVQLGAHANQPGISEYVPRRSRPSTVWRTDAIRRQNVRRAIMPACSEKTANVRATADHSQTRAGLSLVGDSSMKTCG